jgi:SAM-dependent methyltransferase
MDGGKAQDFWLENLGAADRFNRWVLSRFERHLGEDVLEVGCGLGNFTVLMAARGHRVTGIDIDPAYVETARKRLAGFAGVYVACGDATAADWSERFDTVVALDVVEHIEDDCAFLARLARVLKPGGKLVVKVPAAPSLMSTLDRVVGHHRRYDKRSLNETFRAAGLAPLSLSHFNVAGTLGWWLNGKVLKRATPPGEQVKAFETLVPLFRAAESIVPPPFGLSLIGIAASGPA